MYVLDDETKRLIQEITQRGAAQPVFSRKRDSRKIRRGNPLLARRRFRTIEEVDRELDKILHLR